MAVLAAALIFYVVPVPTQAAILTDAQIQAIISLTSSFGVDAGIVSRIEATLRGNVVIDAGLGSTLSEVVEPAHPPRPEQWRHMICKRLLEAQTFPTFGTQSTFAQDLQDFLASEGFFNETTTGYFGTITREAIGKWQEEHGIVIARDVAQGWGVFGPKTREQIKKWCDGGIVRFSAEPTKGVAPLLVTFSTWIGGLRGDRDTVRHYIDFGDDSPREQATECLAPADRCEAPGKNTHTYVTTGTYVARLIKQTKKLDVASEVVVGRTAIHVGSDDVFCTAEFAPVCGAKQVQCITTPCNPVPTTYSNRCKMSADNATFLYVGQCKTTAPFVPDASCKAWNDGCNICTRETPGSPAICTMRACMLGSDQTGYCTAWFDRDTTGNKPPVISGFSGPTKLAVNETGTWTVSASDPENGTLSYHVVWGDEGTDRAVAAGLSSNDSFVQTSSFTHAYSVAGIYVVTITVRDDNGKMGYMSTKVKVGSNATTACTMEAKSCPDGSYVGRTGSNCEFAACPTNTAGSCKLCTAGYGGIVSNGDGTFQMVCKEPETVYPEGSSYNVRCPANSACAVDPGWLTCKSGTWTKTTTSGTNIINTNQGAACSMNGATYADGQVYDQSVWYEGCKKTLALLCPSSPHLLCENGQWVSTTQATQTIGASCTGASGTYAHGSSEDGQMITGGPYTRTAVWPQYMCTNGAWKCSSFCWAGTEGKLYKYASPTPGSTGILKEVTQ